MSVVHDANGQAQLPLFPAPLEATIAEEETALQKASAFSN